MNQKVLTKPLAFTADMQDKVTKGQMSVKVGINGGSDGSRRLLKGENRRQPMMTSSRGFGR